MLQHCEEYLTIFLWSCSSQIDDSDFEQSFIEMKFIYKKWWWSNQRSRNSRNVFQLATDPVLWLRSDPKHFSRNMNADKMTGWGSELINMYVGLTLIERIYIRSFEIKYLHEIAKACSQRRESENSGSN